MKVSKRLADFIVYMLLLVGIGVALGFATSVLGTTIGTNIETSGSLTVTGTTTFNGVNYLWPSTDGTNGQFLSTDGSGSLSWTTPSPASGGGWTDDGSVVRLTGSDDQISIGTNNPISPAVLSVTATSSAASAMVLKAAASPGVDIFSIRNSSGANLFSLTSTSSLVLSEGLLHLATTTGTSTIANNLNLAGTLQVGSSVYLTTSKLNFTSASTIGTDAGALTVNPAAGSDFIISLSGAGDLVVNTNDFFVDTSTGNIGIATTTPANTLSIDGSLSVGTNYGYTAPTNGAIIEGNVGVGTTTPAENFAVNGDAFMSSSATTTLYIHSTGSGMGGCIELMNPAGSKYRIYVSNAGALTVESGTCQ